MSNPILNLLPAWAWVPIVALSCLLYLKLAIRIGQWLKRIDHPPIPEERSRQIHRHMKAASAQANGVQLSDRAAKGCKASQMRHFR
jgi:hypothetical protein